MTYCRSRAGKEDQRAEICSALIAERSGGIDEGGNTVGLDSGANNRGSPCSGSRGGFLGFEELLL